MPIPKIKTPIYSITLPESGKKVSFRPFLSGEYKSLLTIVTFDDIDGIVETMLGVLKNCIQSDTNIEELSFVDVERLFLEIYAKSGDPTINASYRCHAPDKDNKPCDTQFILPIPITDITVSENPISNIVMLDDVVGIKLKTPNFADWFKIQKTLTDDDELVLACIDCIFENDTIYKPFVDSTKEELIDFVNHLDKKSSDHIAQFIENIPTVTFTREISCPKCGTKSTIQLKGLSDFFV